MLHEIDGIQELDNDLPNWWLWTLYGAIIFAAGYWIYYDALKLGKTPLQEYQAEVAALEATKAKQQLALGEATPEALLELSKNAGVVAKGTELYQQNCAACHAPNGGGGIGPNLTDSAWLHGGAPDKVYVTIRDGVTAKGMPAWGPALGEESVRAATAFVLSIHGTNVAGGKAPQGDEE